MLNPQGYIKIGIGLSCFTIPRHCGPLMVLTHHISGRTTIVIEGMLVKTKSDPDLDSLAQLVERVTVNHDVTGSRPVGGVNRLIAKTQATNRGLAVSLKKKRTK